ncbi:hypothetical protein [Streptomyces sp. NPDC005568]|uniref:PH-like domain-containing protein n=1 Tax=Streptomyces sp. NPDC005568 TaxID=3156887 RepID=UPI00339EE81D
MTSLQPTYIAAGQKSAEVTDWAARIGWLVGLVLFVALVYWLMREGWKWRGTLQGDLPELPTRPAPAAPDEDGPRLPGMPTGPGPARLTMSGRYHGSTTAGQWLDRIVAHGLGTRSRVELTLTDAGLDVVRRRPRRERLDQHQRGFSGTELTRAPGRADPRFPAASPDGTTRNRAPRTTDTAHPGNTRHTTSPTPTQAAPRARTAPARRNAA